GGRQPYVLPLQRRAAGAGALGAQPRRRARRGFPRGASRAAGPAMKPSVWVPAVVAMAIYLPTARYGFVQDDRAIVVSNPAAHKITDAIRAFDDPYWPRASGAGLYRPLTIVTYAVDWTLSGGRPGSFHVMNAFWHGLATLLAGLLLARWLPP